jgi:hypothetical protein
MHSSHRRSARLSTALWMGALLAAALPACAQQGTPRASGPAPTEVWEYRIERGDTLIGLHERYMRPDARWQVVQRLNRIENPRRLQPGRLLRIPLALLRGEPVAAETVHTHGEVFVERTGTERQALVAPAELREGDVVTTGAQSSVSVRFVDGSTTLLGPDGRLRIERHARLAPGGPADTRLRLDAGGVETQVVPTRPANRFQLRTPVVNLGVRGTEFRSRLEGERVIAEVLEGRVAVGPRTVSAGFGTVATAGGVATPRPLPAEPGVDGLPALVQRLPLQFDFPGTADAVRYRAQVFDADRPGRLLLDSVFDNPSAAWPDDIADGQYLLRLRAVSAEGIESRDAVQAFTLKARPEPPFQLRPRAGEAVQPDAVEFEWSQHPQAVRYRLQVSGTADFSSLLVDRDDLTGTTFTATLPPGSYHWRMASVRAGDDSGPWGDGAPFIRLPPPPPPPPPPPAPPPEPPQTTDAGVVLRWSTVGQPGVRYQVQVARDPAFTQLVLDETTDASEYLLPKPEPGRYHVRVRSVGADGRAGGYGQAQVVEVSGGYGWLWFLPLLLLL